MVEGPRVAGVKVTGTQGGAGGSLYTWAACEQWAEKANEAIEAGYEALFDGNMAGASEKFGEAVKYINEGESAGCIFG